MAEYKSNIMEAIQNWFFIVFKVRSDSFRQPT